MTSFDNKTGLDLLADAGAILRDLSRGFSLRDMHLSTAETEKLVDVIANRLDAAGHTDRAEFLDLVE